MEVNFKSLARIPKVQVSILLFILFSISASIIGFAGSFRLIVFCIGFAVLIDLAFAFFRIKKLIFPSAAIVTGLILALIIDPSASWFHIAFIAAAAMAMKHFGRFSGRHVFNPAAFGLLAGWMFFGLNPSWWAATLLPWGQYLLSNTAIYAVLFGIGYVSCFVLRRYPAAAAYLTASLVFSFFNSQSVLSALQIVASPGVLFFTLVMLVEPMTSPTKKERQLMYGAFVAVVQMLLVLFGDRLGIESLPDYSLVGLLLGNLIFFRYR